MVRLLLLTLGTWMDGDGKNCFPSAQEVADSMRVARPTFFTLLKEAAGWIDVQSKAGVGSHGRGGTDKTNRYVPTIPTRATVSPHLTVVEASNRQPSPDGSTSNAAEQPSGHTESNRQSTLTQPDQDQTKDQALPPSPPSVADGERSGQNGDEEANDAGSSSPPDDPTNGWDDVPEPKTVDEVLARLHVDAKQATGLRPLVVELSEGGLPAEAIYDVCTPRLGNARSAARVISWRLEKVRGMTSGEVWTWLRREVYPGSPPAPPWAHDPSGVVELGSSGSRESA
jgi:hypothetical protein